ncbi:MAG: DNA-binding protein, partial [Sulfolobaceae archaeon]
TVVASFISWTRERLEKPEIIGIIKLEPSRPNDWIFPGIFHRICASYDEVRNMSLFGKKVKAVWKNKNERIGSINDIECFKVIE